MPLEVHWVSSCFLPFQFSFSQLLSRSALLGPPGIGKTVVAATVLYDERTIDRFGTCRHWADLGVGDVTSFDIVLDILHHSLLRGAYGHSGDLPQSQYSANHCSKDRLSSTIAAIRSTPAPRFLVINDFERTWETMRSDIEPILAELCSIPHLTVLITMRGATILPPLAWRLDIDTISPRAAKLLFLTVYPHSDPVLDKLLGTLDYLPLAIVLVAHACQTHGITPSVLTERWGRNQTELLELQGEGSDNLATSIRSSMDSVAIHNSPHATKLLSILSMLPSGIVLDELHRMAPGIGDVDEVARMLTNISLASTNTHGGLRLLSPVKSYLLKYHQLDDPSRQALYSYHFALAKQGLCRPGDSRFPAAMQALVAKQHNIEAILEDALDSGCLPAAEAALQYSAPRCAIQPRLDILAKAAEVARKDGAIELTSCCLQRLGEMNIAAGNYHEGRDDLRKAIDLYEQRGNRLGIAECQLAIAECIWINSLGDGIAHLERTRQDFVQIGNVPGDAKCSLRLGNLYMNGGRVGDARAAYDRALANFGAVKDVHGVARCKQEIAGIHIRQGRWVEAQVALDAALETLSNFGDRSAVAKCQRSLSFLHQREGRMQEAREALMQAIDEHQFLGQNLDVAWRRRELAQISEDEDAIALYELAIPQFWLSKFIYAGAETRLSLGYLHMRMGRLSDALLNLEISRLELLNNGTKELASQCLVAIIQCLCADDQTAAASLTLENNVGEIRRYVAGTSTQSGSRQLLPDEVDVTIKDGHMVASVKPMMIEQAN